MQKSIKTGIPIKADMIFKAIEFAAKAHSGQYRKGTRIPYIYHPMDVARILMKYKYPHDVIIAGLLHDTIEDTPVTADIIRATFNENIAILVIGASEKNKQDTWDNRKKETISALKTASPDLLALACADKLNNIRAIKQDYKEFGEKLWDRFNQPAEKQKWYYTSLSSLFNERIKEFEDSRLAQAFIKTVSKVFNQQ